MYKPTRPTPQFTKRLVKLRVELERLVLLSDVYAQPELAYQLDTASQALDEAIAQVTYNV